MLQVQSDTGIFLLTVDQLEGYEVVEYYGLVHGQAIYGANFLKDFFARMSDKFGGRVGGYEKALAGAVDAALASIAADAHQLGANAVLGIDVKTGFIGQSMVTATCTGTAVKARRR